MKGETSRIPRPQQRSPIDSADGLSPAFLAPQARKRNCGGCVCFRLRWRLRHPRKFRLGFSPSSSRKMFYHVSRARGGGEGRVKRRRSEAGAPGRGAASCPIFLRRLAWSQSIPPLAPQISLEHEILLHPRYFGPNLLNTVKQKLFTEVEGTCTGK